jgi:cellulose synthase operon protein B
MSKHIATLLAGAALFSVVLAMPSHADDLTGFSFSAPADDGVLAVAGGTASSPKLRPLPASPAELTFAGETTNREIPFYVTPAQTVGDIRLALTVESAVSNAPESSRMRVFVNDSELQTIHLTAGDPRRTEILLPAGLIQPGFNALTFLVDQHHRVDCSIESTYELWSRIDPAASGFLFSGDADATGTLAELMALARTSGGKTEMRGRVSPATDGADLQNLIVAMQTLSIAGLFDAHSVSFGEAAGEGPGIDILIGDRALLASLLPAGASVPSGGIRMVENRDTGRTSLVLAATSDIEIERQLDELRALAGDASPSGVGPGLRALANMRGRELRAGEPTTLSSLGFVSRAFAGRYYRDAVNFSMPADFYPGDYGNARLRLSALFAPGLQRDAELLIKLNGQTVSTISLGASRTGVIRDQQLPIPLSHFRPGENVLTFEGRLPAAVDESCELAAVANPSARLQISGDTTFEIPSMARIGRFPDIAATVAGSSIEGRGWVDRREMTVLLPEQRGAALDAAATFMTKLAYSSGQVYEPKIVGAMPGDDTGALLAVGDYEQLPGELLAGFNVATAPVPEFVEASPASIDALRDVDTAIDPVSVEEPATEIAGERESALPDFVERLRDPARLGAEMWTATRSGFAAARDFVGDMVRWPGDGEARTLRHDNATAMVIAQRANPMENGVWTLLAAPSANDLQATTQQITRRDLWAGLNGSALALAPTGEVIQRVDGPRQFLFETQPRSFNNGRLILAGWFSRNLDRYALSLFIVCVLLGVSTFLYLQKVGGRRK